MSIASEIFMIRPAAFGYNAETAASNAFQQMQQNVLQNEISESAIKEFDAFVQKLENHQIRVTVFPDSKTPAKPDAVFPNNWLATMPGGDLYIFPMEAKNRRIEKRKSIVDFFIKNYIVKNVTDYSSYEKENVFLEGTGSIIMDHANKIMYACISTRTNKNLFIEFAEINKYRPVYFSSTLKNGKPIYHTNVMMHVGEKYVVICLETIRDEEEKKLLKNIFKNTDKKIIDISIEQMKIFAGNMLQIKNAEGKNFTILSQTAYDALTDAQKNDISLESTLLPISVKTIEGIGGGSVRCMMAEIFLEKRMAK